MEAKKARVDLPEERGVGTNQQGPAGYADSGKVVRATLT